MDVVGAATVVSALPPFHFSLGAGLASAVMNLAILFGFSVLSWNFWDGGADADGVTDADKEFVQADQHPLPDYLYPFTNVINICVVGASNSGKSALVDALRCLQGSEGQCRAKAEETTQRPVPHCLLASPREGSTPEDSNLWAGLGPLPIPGFIWDTPGVNTQELPVKTCTRDMGLAHFDAVIVVYSGRITDVERRLVAELEEWAKVPHFLVRTQVDVDIDNEAADYDRSEEEVLAAMRREATEEGFSTMFLVSSRDPLKFDMAQLRQGILSLVKARQRSIHVTECPICFNGFESDGVRSRYSCHWCGNAVCGPCAIKVRGKHREAPCPFCRRWTALAKLPLC